MTYKDQLKKETIIFLENYVFNNSNFKEINEKNADKIIDYIVVEYINNLVSRQEEGEKIDEKMLKEAENAIDDICSH